MGIGAISFPSAARPMVRGNMTSGLRGYPLFLGVAAAAGALGGGATTLRDGLVHRGLRFWRKALIPSLLSAVPKEV